MKGSGLEEILSVAYGGVKNMLNGKAWPKAVRGLRMVAAAILDDFITVEQPQSKHLSMSYRKQASLQQVDCLIMPVVIIHMFLRAEREDDWFLHLCCVKQMLPYLSLIHI